MSTHNNRKSKSMLINHITFITFTLTLVTTTVQHSADQSITSISKSKSASSSSSSSAVLPSDVFRLRRSPNPQPQPVDSMSSNSLYSALPAARSGNSAIFFGGSHPMSSMNNVNSNEVFSVDNRKPAFKNCAGYAPLVKEEQPENTFVIKVQADDPDPDQEIRYSLAQSPSERPKFHINANTGVIVTAHTFDRDEPIHEKAVYVTVQATDNGRPPLDDVCTFPVTIEDINDNPPVFNKARYDESMSEDMQVSIDSMGESLLGWVVLKCPCYVCTVPPYVDNRGLLRFGGCSDSVDQCVLHKIIFFF